jgi:predicted DsbA family dithiol-disulfide isomerase
VTDDTPRRIQVYSDYVCPFCYLGRAALDQYQSTRETELEIEWHPFDLRSHQRRPDGTIDTSVDDGKDEAYFERAKENVRRLQERYGVEMELDLSRDIDSFDAQVVSYYVHEQYDYETWLAFDEAVFEALWTEGRDIGGESVLVELAETVGIDAAKVRSVLKDETLDAELRGRFGAAQERGITGVPTFVYGEHGARGAIPPEQFERLIEGV